MDDVTDEEDGLEYCGTEYAVIATHENIRHSTYLVRVKMIEFYHGVFDLPPEEPVLPENEEENNNAQLLINFTGANLELGHQHNNQNPNPNPNQAH